jgi:hypothetical protein
MKFAGQIIQIKRDSVRLMCASAAASTMRGKSAICRSRPARPDHQPLDIRIAQEGNARLAASSGSPGTVSRGILEDRMAARVAVLDIENRVVLGLLDHLGEGQNRASRRSCGTAS